MPISSLPPTTRFWWIRHGPVHNPEARLQGGREDPPLAPLSGADQDRLKALAAILPRGGGWVATPLQRCRATASALRAAMADSPRFGVPLSPVQIDPALIEQDFGRWGGLSHDAIAATEVEAAAHFWQDPAGTAPPEGESFAALARRVRDRILALLAVWAGQDVVLVVHGGTVRAALGLALDLAPAQMLRFEIAPLSLTRLDHCGGPDPGWRLGLVNWCVNPFH